ncbi:unnamed protein product, partial [marine sediment metagenome]
WTEAVLRKAFKKEVGADVAKVYRKTGDFAEAVKKGKELAGNSPYLRQNREVLESMAAKMRSGQPLTPKHLDAEVLKAHPMSGDKRPFYDLVSKGEEVLGEAVEESTVSGRRSFNKLSNLAKTAAGASLIGVAPYAALIGGTRAATSKPVQNFMMGRGLGNKAIRKTEESLLADALRNTIAAQEY